MYDLPHMHSSLGCDAITSKNWDRGFQHRIVEINVMCTQPWSLS